MDKMIIKLESSRDSAWTVRCTMIITADGLVDN